MGFKNTLYVTGFSRDTKAKDLAPDFEKFGALVRVDLPPPRHADASPYAFVEFEEKKDAESALELHDKPFGDDAKPLTVQWAKSEPHPPRSRGGYRDDYGAPRRGGFRDDYGPPRRGGYRDDYGPPRRGGYRDDYRDDYGPPRRGGGYREDFREDYGPPRRGGYRDDYRDYPPRRDEYRRGGDDRERRGDDRERRGGDERRGGEGEDRERGEYRREERDTYRARDASPSRAERQASRSRSPARD